MDNVVISKIERLFLDWYRSIMFDSTGTKGWNEKAELISYCKQHVDEFKEFAYDTLAHPQEFNHLIPGLCSAIFPDVQVKEISFELLDFEKLSFLEKLKYTIIRWIQTFKKIDYSYYDYYFENTWLNYFAGTQGINYYKDWSDYKSYLSKNYISWKPNVEDDPNPTYEEFINNRIKYDKKN